MGKRTSDFMAFAAILGGAGLGLGVTSLFAQSRAYRVPHSDDSSVRVRVLRHAVIVEPGRIADARAEAYIARAEAYVVRHALIERIEGHQIAVIPEAETRMFRMRTRVRTTVSVRNQLERLRAQVEELRREAGEVGEIMELSEALEKLEALEDRHSGEVLRIEILRNDEDRKRRRRRRPPHRVTEATDFDGPGN
jgi:hypothetical protein